MFSLRTSLQIGLRTFGALLLLLLAGALSPATAQYCATVQPLKYTSTTVSIRTATDPAGNTYCAGSFQGTLEVGNVRITPAPNDLSVNLYVAKFDPQGQLVWLKHGGGPSNEVPNAIALDGIGSVYVSGVNGVNFQFGTVTVADEGTHLLKLDAATGDALWARSLGTIMPLTGGGFRGIYINTIVANGTSLYLAGHADLNTSIDGIPLQVSTLSSTGLALRCTPAGAVTGVWQSVPQVDSAFTSILHMQLDSNGDVVLFGGYQRTVQFGTAAGSPVKTARVISPLSRAEGFVARIGLSATGGTTLSVLNRLPWVTAAALDPASGTSYITGYTPRDSVGTMAIADSGLYVAALTRQGVVRWATSHPTQAIIPTGLAFDQAGRVYTNGTFYSPVMQLGPYTLGGQGVIRGPFSFFACHDATGALQWARGADNRADNNELFWGASIDAAGRLYAAGISLNPASNAPLTRYDGLPVPHRTPFLLRLDPAAEVSGTVYLDQNANGQRDPGEGAFPRPVVVQELTNPTAPLTYTSDADGLYHALLLPGPYDLQAVPPTYYTVSQPQTNRHQGTLTAIGQIQSGRDFGVAPIANRPDVRVTLTPYTRARRGFANRYLARVENLGTTTIGSGRVSVELDAAVSFIGGIPSPASQSGQVVSWNFTNLAPFATRDYLVAVDVPLNLALGDQIRSTATVGGVANDLDLTNNVDSVQQIVVGSWDPNDLMVNYSSLTPAQIAAGTLLDYTIRFQNMGTDTAFTVVIQDTLPAHLLRMGTLQLVSSSHNCWWSIVGNNRLTVRFERINLPDHNVDVTGSMGFVRFQIAPRSTLVAGELIPNTAHIFFDFNAPLSTNEVTTLVQTPNGLVAEPGAGDARMRLYPNPATETVTLTGAEAGATVTLFDGLGRAVSTSHLAPGTSHLNLRGLAPGLYVVEVAAPGRAPNRQRLVVRGAE